MTPPEPVRAWLLQAWEDVGRSFADGPVPVVRVAALDPANLMAAFRAEPVGRWRLGDDGLHVDPTAAATRVPFVAFSLDEATGRMVVHTHWAVRCGMGQVVRFGEDGEVVERRVAWMA